MKVEEWHRIFHQELVAVFKEECSRRGVNLKELARQAGYAEDYFYLVRSGRRRLTVDLLLKICEHLGRSPVELFRRFAAAGAADPDRKIEVPPAHLLAFLREEGEGSPDPFLARAIDVIAAAREKKTSQDRETLSLRSVVLQLEESRLSAPDFAKRKLEQLGRRLLVAIRRRPQLEAVVLGDLAAVLAAWAALRRLAGHRADANDALCTAFELANQVEDSWLQGFCHQKAAYLLQDLGRAELGLTFIEKATLFFNEAGASLDLARSLVDRGYMLACCERLEESNRAFEAALRQLPASEKLYLCSAHYNLAVNARRAGELVKAARQLEKAAEFCHRADLRHAHLRRELGLIELQLGQFEAAALHLGSALKGFGNAGQMSQATAVALDVAEVLVRANRIGEAEALAREVASWFPAKVTNRLQQELLEDFFAIIQLGQLSMPSIERVRERLKEMPSRKVGS